MMLEISRQMYHVLNFVQIIMLCVSFVSSLPTSIPPNLRFPVYCTAIAEGDQDEWNFAFGKLKEAGDDSGAEEKNLLQAMACTRRDWLLRR